MTEQQHLAELRAELANCYLTKRQRREAEALLRRVEEAKKRDAA